MFSLFRHKNTAVSLICQFGPLTEAALATAAAIIGYLIQNNATWENTASLLMGVGFFLLCFDMPLFAIRGIIGIFFSVRALRKKEPKRPNIILIITLSLMTVLAVYATYFVWFVSVPSV